jgi:hypothetical protein
MNKQITIQFTPDSTVEFVGEECAEAYEQAVKSAVQSAYPDAEIGISNDSSFGTKISAYGFGETDIEERDEEENVRLVVEDVLTRIGNNLTEICS